MSHFHKLLLETRLSFTKADHIFKRLCWFALGRLFIISYFTIGSQRRKKGHTERLRKPPLPLTSESKTVRTGIETCLYLNSTLCSL